MCHCQQPTPHLKPNNSLPSHRRRRHRPNPPFYRRAFSSSEAANRIFVFTFTFTFTFTTEFASLTTREKDTHRESSAVPVVAATRGPRQVEGVDSR